MSKSVIPAVRLHTLDKRRNGCGRSAKAFRYFIHGDALFMEADYFSRRHLDHSAKSQSSCGMLNVFSAGDPLKIVQAIIRAIKVFVIYNIASWRPFQKSLCHKPMNAHKIFLSSKFQGQLVVSLVFACLQYARCVANTTLITDFKNIAPRLAHKWLPYLVIHSVPPANHDGPRV